jgi:hypothetical protein
VIAALVLVVGLVQERAVTCPVHTSTAHGPGSELRIHDASALTGHAALAQRLEQLASGPLAPGGEACGALANLRQERRRAEEAAEGMVRLFTTRLALSEGELQHLGGGRLALLAPPERQTELAAALDAARGFRGRIRVEARIYFGLGTELPPEATTHGLVLPKARAEEIERKLERTSKELVSAPVVTALPWLAAHLAALDKVPYVKDYALTSVPGLDTVIADPEIAVLELGFELELHCAPAEGSRNLLLVGLEHRRLKEPLRDFETRLGESEARVTVQLANVLAVGLEGLFELDESEALLLVGGEGDERAALLLRATRVTDAR